MSAELIGFDEFFGQASESFDPFSGLPLQVGEYIDDFMVLGQEGDWNLLSGATGANVYFRGSPTYQLTVHGTNQFRDAMTVNANRFYVNFVGHGGDDLFFLGSNAAQADGYGDVISGAGPGPCRRSQFMTSVKITSRATRQFSLTVSWYSALVTVVE